MAATLTVDNKATNPPDPWEWPEIWEPPPSTPEAWEVPPWPDPEPWEPLPPGWEW